MSTKRLWIIILAASVAVVFASAHWQWFKDNEHVAIWLEGVALVLIFGLDLINRKEEHEEITAQLSLATQQNQSLMNSERAWLTARLRWYEGNLRIAFLDSQVSGTASSTKTASSFLLELTNDGKTPAWVESVSGGMEISGRARELELPISEYIEPIGAGKTQQAQLTLTCDGQPKDRGESLQVHITISYRDIFERRVMALEFSVDPSSYAIRRLERVNVEEPK